MVDLDWLISVDDHVIEPAGVWQDRLPKKFLDVGPKLVRNKTKSMSFVGGVFSYEEAGPGEDGTWCDWWHCEDLRSPLTRLSAAAESRVSGERRSSQCHQSHHVPSSPGPASSYENTPPTKLIDFVLLRTSFGPTSTNFFGRRSCQTPAGSIT